MLGFKAFHSAAATVAGIEIAHMIRKGQFGTNDLSAFQQFAAPRSIIISKDWTPSIYPEVCDITCDTAVCLRSEPLRQHINGDCDF